MNVETPAKPTKPFLGEIYSLDSLPRNFKLPQVVFSRGEFFIAIPTLNCVVPAKGGKPADSFTRYQLKRCTMPNGDNRVTVLKKGDKPQKFPDTIVREIKQQAKQYKMTQSLLSKILSVIAIATAAIKTAADDETTIASLKQENENLKQQIRDEGVTLSPDDEAKLDDLINHAAAATPPDADAVSAVADIAPAAPPAETPPAETPPASAPPAKAEDDTKQS